MSNYGPSKLVDVSNEPPPHSSSKQVCPQNCWLRKPVEEKTPQTILAEEQEYINEPLITREQATKTLYAPLKHWQTRVLQLKPGSFSNPLRCKLLTVDLVYLNGAVLHGQPEHIFYEAVSYTWGTSVFDKLLLCNDTLYPITSNLSDALRHIRLSHEPKYLWADAVCVNQLDEQEKAEQVRKMSVIFQKAERVIAWLGEHEDQSELAVALVNGTNIGGLEQTVHSNKCLLHLNAMVRAYGRVTNRPWFRRTWVRQEVAAARKMVVRLGNTVIDWGIFTAVFHKSPALNQLLRAIGGYTDINSIKSRVLSLVNHKNGVGGSDLFNLLLSSWYFQETDPRDKVYALLDMTNTPTRNQGQDKLPNSIVVDYKKTVSEVYQDVTKYLINHHNLLHVLVNFTIQKDYSLGLPSWTSDWGKKPKEELLEPILMEWHKGPLNWFRPEGEDQPGKLTVSGCTIGIILEITGETYEANISDDLVTVAPRKGFAQLIRFDATIHDRILCHGIVDKTIFDEEESVNFGACVYSSAKKNDFLVSLFGSDKLFVLRHVGNVEYEFHGPATRLSGALLWISYHFERPRPQKFVLI